MSSLIRAEIFKKRVSDSYSIKPGGLKSIAVLATICIDESFSLKHLDKCPVGEKTLRFGIKPQRQGDPKR